MLEKYAATRAQWPQAQLGLFQEDERVKSLIEDIKRRWPDIVRRGAFVFDVDMTILPKGSRALTFYKELAYLFMRLLREGVQVRIVSGNSEEEQMQRIHDAIKEEMKDDLSSLDNLSFYVNGGATKIGFRSGQLVRDEAYNVRHAMEVSTLRKAVNQALKARAADNFDLSPEQLSEYIENLQRGADGLTLLTPWKDGGEWEPQWLTPQELNVLKAAGGSVIFPWIEMRGKFNSAEGAEKVASIGIKPTPDVRGVPIRDALQNSIRGFLPNPDDFNIRSGGGATTDITHIKADKVAAILDVLISKGLDPELVFYLGDEFFKRLHQIGNDEMIARVLETVEKLMSIWTQDSDGDIMERIRTIGKDDNVSQALTSILNKIVTLALNADDMTGAAAKTIHIGRSPQGLLEFLEEVVIQQAEIEATTDGALLTQPGGIDFNPGLLDLRAERRQPLPPVMLPLHIKVEIMGLSPKITSVTPLPDLMPLLGFGNRREKDEG